MTWPAAEVSIDEALVRTLIESQFPQFADLSCYQVDEGFDNALWRLGDELVVRLPRRQMAVEPLEHELRWLPEIAGHVTLQTPLPHLAGAASEDFAWPWLIARWIDGVPGDSLTADDRRNSAAALATFFREIHITAPPEAPLNPYRGGPLLDRSATFETRILEISDVADVLLVRQLWASCLAAPKWAGVPLWLHGDPHPGNTLYRNKELVGVVDFGDLCAGDPATDLAGGLMSLPFEALEEFFDTYGGIDNATIWRTIGWAVHFGVLFASLGVVSRPSYLALGQLSLDNAARLAATLKI
jgi:aminoglycoside phosphotransferase (APT) family kinase protein